MPANRPIRLPSKTPQVSPLSLILMMRQRETLVRRGMEAYAEIQREQSFMSNMAPLEWIQTI